MKHNKMISDQPNRNDTKIEKITWEKPKIIDLQVKETFGDWDGPNRDADKRRIS